MFQTTNQPYIDISLPIHALTNIPKSYHMDMDHPPPGPTDLGRVLLQRHNGTMGISPILGQLRCRHGFACGLGDADLWKINKTHTHIYIHSQLFFMGCSEIK